MASPQTENGFAKLANEVLDALMRAQFTGRERNVLDMIFRHSYGYQRKEARLSLSHIARRTGIDRSNVHRILVRLETLQVIKRQAGAIGFQKNYDLWDRSVWRTTVVTDDNTSVVVDDNSPVVTDDNTSVVTGDNNSAVAVVTDDNTPVVTDDNSPIKVLKIKRKKKTYVETGSVAATRVFFVSDSNGSDSNSKRRSPTPGSAAPLPVGEWFDEIWSRYPSKDGKKAAMRSFRATVKTEDDWGDIQHALDNYLASERVQKGFIKNGSTWFANWQDWLHVEQPATNGAPAWMNQ